MKEVNSAAPYQIRAKILEMAKSAIEAEYFSRKDNLMFKIDQCKVKPDFADLDLGVLDLSSEAIVARAKKLNEFILDKS